MLIDFIEPALSIVVLAAIFYGGLVGAREGLFRAFARLCFGLLAFLVAMRWWYPGTTEFAERLSVAPEQVSFAAFWGIYAVMILPFLAGVKTLNHDFIPAYPVILERFAGFVFGAVNAGIIASAVLISFTLNLPKVLPTYDEARFLLPIHRVPTLLYRNMENTLTPAKAASKSRTLLPVVERKTPQSDMEIRWE